MDASVARLSSTRVHVHDLVAKFCSWAEQHPLSGAVEFRCSTCPGRSRKDRLIMAAQQSQDRSNKNCYPHAHIISYNDQLFPSKLSILRAGTAKPIRLAAGSIAIMIPITSPALSTSGPPLFPGLTAASVWIRSVE